MIYVQHGDTWLIIPKRRASEALANPNRPHYALRVDTDGSESVRPVRDIRTLPGNRVPAWQVPAYILGRL